MGASEDDRDERAPLVLASGSPRRRDLLTAAGVALEIRPSGIEEKAEPGETPAALALRLATEKALDVARGIGPTPDRIVLGADTIVVLGEDVLGKPESPSHAVEMLLRLTGQRHEVITGVAVVSSRRLQPVGEAFRSTVEMRPAEREEIERYVAGGEPLDKAGGYALQGDGRRFVTAVHGSESNVIGLPVAEALALVARVSHASQDARD